MDLASYNTQPDFVIQTNQANTPKHQQQQSLKSYEQIEAINYEPNAQNHAVQQFHSSQPLPTNQHKGEQMLNFGNHQNQALHHPTQNYEYIEVNDYNSAPVPGIGQNHQ